jgi:hypothetical protein
VFNIIAVVFVFLITIMRKKKKNTL